LHLVGSSVLLYLQNVLLNEKGLNDPNPLYQLARDITLHNQITTSGFSLILTSSPHTHTHTHTQQGKPIKSIDILQFIKSLIT